MSWVQDMFPWLTSNLQAMNQRVASLKDCKAMHTLRLLMVFVLDHPIMSLFLAMLMTLCCLPIIVILAFASSSTVLISLSALVVLGGTFLVALFSFLVVLSPILVSGGILAVVLYISFGVIMRMFHELFNEGGSRQPLREMGKDVTFPCKMTANVSTGVLDTCNYRVSIRKETKGGKAHIKLGFADVNLAEFAGSASTTKRYILEGYEDKTLRQDNSILEVAVSMQLTSGDPLFKVPYAPSDNQATTETAENRAPPSDHHDSVNNTTPGAEARKSILSSSPGSTSESQETAGSNPDKVSFIPGHARSFSEPPCSISSSHNRSISQLSRISGYSTGHSFSSSLEGKSSRRKQSSGSGQANSDDTAFCDSEQTLSPPPERQGKRISWKKQDDQRSSHNRVNADDVIEQLFSGQNFSGDENPSGDELQVNQLSMFFTNIPGGYSRPIPEDKYRTL
ncbi:hypothetical protein OS493_026357 [Desmophyllum pertusum]|uniref:C2 NT-type domain-containing protein n=1 Tax=Desmophyllum pertusum TaxID=174260 RepID=A0A9X0CW66_9CNID|nr:hypothetical protein OS493_026357 [Desmophyllum pertusum]